MSIITTITNITDNETTPLKTLEEINSIIRVNTTALNILHINIRSILNHLPELECLNNTLDNKNHIIITSESWLSPNFNHNYLPLKGYQTISTNNNVRKSDGVIVFIKNGIDQSNTEYDILDANCILTIIKNININYGILCIYRSPSGNIIKFIEDLNTLITNIIQLHNNIPLIIIGDININILDTTNSTSLYLDLLNTYGFV